MLVFKIELKMLGLTVMQQAKPQPVVLASHMVPVPVLGALLLIHLPAYGLEK